MSVVPFRFIKKRSNASVSRVILTLYSGYVEANLQLTREAMNPAPPVKRITFGVDIRNVDFYANNSPL